MNRKAVDDLRLNSLVQKLKNLINTLIKVHTDDTNNPHNVTKIQIGLSDVDNTSDMAKPISDATRIALNNKLDSDQVVTDAEANKVLRLNEDGKYPRSAIEDYELLNLNITLNASEWNEHGIYTITDDNINVDTDGILYLAKNITDEVCSEAIASVIRIYHQDTGVLKLKCIVKPGVDIPVTLTLYK